ncbi:MAG: DUF1501 domain-containing protein [Bryobacterales bacterium]|nr:DUF1501 domain-containing protein [Bryobacterales bacterium]
MDLGEYRKISTRRHFFRYCAGGIDAAALAVLAASQSSASSAPGPANPLTPKTSHFEPTAKNVIFLLMAGAPSQIDLYDPKPALKRWHGQPLPESMTKDLSLAFVKPSAKVLASPRVFRRHGESGTEFSDYIPHIASRADDICLLRSMHTEAFNHHPGQSLLMSGSTQLGRPTIGSWVSYGLGSESENLPAFVVLSSGRGSSGGSSNWSNGFLDSTYQGVVFRNTGEPILFLENPPGISERTQRARLDAIRKLNQERQALTADSEIASRIQSYELAFRMQAAAPELLDFNGESQSTLDMYGVGKEPTHPYATNCLLARRMVEKGVRFVMLVHASWDDHQEIDRKLGNNCAITDQPAGALLKDLKQRGLLDSTLVVWGGEFGRTPMGQLERVDEAAGRDHHAKCFSAWMAGGGVRGGQVVGKTDELGLGIEEHPVHVHDLQATILHALGLDHERLTYRHMGRDFRLTDIGGTVISQALA